MDARQEIIKTLGEDKIKELQVIVDDPAKTGPYGQYVQQHKLGLIDGRMETIDQLLDLGVLVVR